MTALDSAARVWWDWMWPMAWQVAVLATAVLIVTLLVRRRSAHLRYWLWCLVLVKLCLPPSLAFFTGIGGLLPAERPTVPPVVTAPAATMPAPVATEFAATPAPIAAAPQLQATPLSAPRAVAVRAPFPWRAALLTVWAAGLLAMAALLALQYVLIRRRVASGSAVTDATALSLLAEARAAVGVRQRVALVAAEDMASPVLFGLVRPRIVLPASALALPASELRPILLHELSHLRRRDLWVNWVQAVLQSVYWFHPAVWAANARLRRERELIVDDMVLARLGGERAAYGASLLSVMKQSARRRMLSPGYVGIAEPPGSVAARVRRILDGQRRLSLRLGLLGAAFVLALALVLIPLGRAQVPPSTRAWQAKLPNGVAVELLGVCYDPSEARQWWRPDGSPLAQAPYDSIGYGVGYLSPDAREFALRFGDTERDDLNITLRVDPNHSQHWVDAPPHRAGGPVGGRRAVAALFLAGQTAATVRVGVAAGEWATLARSNDARIGLGFQGADYKVQFEAIRDEERIGATVTYAFLLEAGKADMASRLVAVDLNGEPHVARVGGPRAGRLSLETAIFPGLAASSIKQLRFEVCPYDWVEFRNVSLVPGKKTNVEVVVESAAATAPPPKEVAVVRWMAAFDEAGAERIRKMSAPLTVESSSHEALTCDGGRLLSAVAEMVKAREAFVSPVGKLKEETHGRTADTLSASYNGELGGRPVWGNFVLAGGYTLEREDAGARLALDYNGVILVLRCQGQLAPGRAWVFLKKSELAESAQQLYHLTVWQAVPAADAGVPAPPQETDGAQWVVRHAKEQAQVGHPVTPTAAVNRADGTPAATGGIQEEPRWVQAERARSQPLADKVLSMLGQGWQMEMRKVTALNGWSGRINGFALEFRSESLKATAGGEPAAFRITVANWQDPTHEDGAEAKEDFDSPMGASAHHKWYCNPGSFGRDYPEQWRALLASVREAFAIPEPTGGIQCRISPGIDEMSEDLFVPGRPVGLPVSIRFAGDYLTIGLSVLNVTGKRLTVLDIRDGLLKDVIVKDEAGRRLPYTGQPPPPRANESALSPGLSIGASLSLRLGYDMAKPGRYTIQVPYRFGAGAGDVALSQPVTIEVVPRDFLAFHVRRTAEVEPVAVGSPIPVELELIHAGPGVLDLKDLSLHLSANGEEPRHWLSAYAPLVWTDAPRPAARSPREDGQPGTTLDLGGAGWRLTEDLAKLGWNPALSSFWSPVPIWNFTKPGETWTVTVSLSGQADGKRFNLDAGAVVFIVAGGPAGGGVSDAPEVRDWVPVSQTRAQADGRPAMAYVYRYALRTLKLAQQQRVQDEESAQNPADYDVTYDYMELVKMPAGDLARLTPQSYQWQASQSVHHVEAAVLGAGPTGEVWLARGPIYTIYGVTRELHLWNGADMWALLAKGLSVQDEGSRTASSCAPLLAEHWDAAVPYIQQVVNAGDDQALRWACETLGLIHSDGATDLLVQLYGQDKTREVAAYGLVHQPYRERARAAYVDMLKRGMRVFDCEAAATQYGWTEALPALRDLMGTTESFMDYAEAFYAVRALEHKRVANELRDMPSVLAGADAQSIEAARRTLLASPDTEGAQVTALYIATAVVFKGNYEPARQMAREVLARLPRERTIDLVTRFSTHLPGEPWASVLDSLRQADKPARN